MIRNTRRSILPAAAILGVIGLGLWASPASAQQLAPWQRPPDYSQPGPPPTGEGPADRSPQTPSLDAAGHASTPWAGEDYEQEGDMLGFRSGELSELICESVHDRYWLRSEFLAWWTKGFATPPLLTTSPTGTAASQAGVLGATGTSVLFGGQDLAGGFLPGERFDFGGWLNGDRTWGVEASYLQLNRETQFFNTGSVSTPILARPIFNVDTGQQDAQAISYPGQQTGTFSAQSSSDLQVVEALVRKNLNRQPGLVVDLVAGYRFQQLDDHLWVGDTLTITGSQTGYPSGSIVQQSDRFDTRNTFQGGVVGVSASVHRQSWTVDALLKVAVGQTNSHVDIEGSTAATIPGESAAFVPGGLLALPSNIGVHNSEQLSVVPELGITLGYDIIPQLRATIGYDIVYWNAVARPGDQIDVNIDPAQIPTFPPPEPVTNSTRPQFSLHTSDYWAQGVNVGLDLRF